MKTTLTDRYVSATLRGLPGGQRHDIERELRASISEAVEDRLEAGLGAQEAEVEVLTGLGDPARLAADYTDRPLHLIGPRLFLGYLRLLTTLLATVVPIVLVVAGLVAFRAGAAPSDAIRGAVLAALTTSMHILFWTTLLYAAFERSPAVRRRSTQQWVPAALPDLPGRRVDVTEGIGGTVAALVVAALLYLTQTQGLVRDAGGDPVGVVAPELWESGALWLVLLFPAVRIVFDLVGFHVGWELPHAVANATLSLLFVVLAVWVTASGRLLNPAFFAAVGWPAGASVPGVLTTVLIVVLVLISVLDAVDGFVRVRRARPS